MSVSAEDQRREWRIAAASVAVLLLLTLALYWQTVVYLTGLWNQFETGEYGHGYLVVGISVFLILRSRRRLISLTPCPSGWALFAIFVAGILWLLAVLVDVNVMQPVGLLLLLLAVTWTILGSRIAKQLAFPILFIGFAIPIWFLFSPLLQDLTAEAVFTVIRFIEVPAFRKENMIVLPAGIMSVEEACSGLRYLLAALTLGTLYAYLNFDSLRARVVVVAIAATAAILANIVRVFIVVYLGYATEMQHPLVRDHLMLGWYLFGGVIAILLLVDMRLSRSYQYGVTHNSVANDASGPGKPVSAACDRGVLQRLLVMILAVVLVSFAPIIAYMVKNQAPGSIPAVAGTMPDRLAQWGGYDGGDDDWTPVYHGATTLKKTYGKGMDRVILFIGLYQAQRQGKELINDVNRIGEPGVWKTIYPRPHLQGTADHRVLEQVLEKSDGRQRLVWYWYTVAGQATTSKYAAKILQVYGLLTGNDEAAVIAVSVSPFGDIEDARQTLGEFVMETGLSRADAAGVIGKQ